MLLINYLLLLLLLLYMFLFLNGCLKPRWGLYTPQRYYNKIVFWGEKQITPGAFRHH